MTATPISDIEPVGIEPYRLWDPSEVFDLEPPTWLMDYVIPESGSVLLYGPTNVGKSLVALDWAFRLAIGYKWLGLSVPKPQKVLYAYAEGGHDLQLRYQAWVEGNDVRDFHRLEQNIRFIGLDEEVGLRWDPDHTDNPPVGVQRLYAAAEEFHPDVVIFDPAQEVWRGLENNSDRHVAMAWRVVKDLRRQYKCAAVVVHHSRKDDVQFRGATTWLDLADVGFSITETSAEGILDLTNTKSRYAEKGKKWKLERRVQALQRVPKLFGQDSVYIAGGSASDTASKEADVFGLLSIENRSYSELSQSLYGRKDASAAARLLGKMMADGLILKEKGRNGKYMLTANKANRPDVI